MTGQLYGVTLSESDLLLMRDACFEQITQYQQAAEWGEGNGISPEDIQRFEQIAEQYRSIHAAIIAALPTER